MQEVVDTREGGIRASGGVLVPAKSHWCLIQFIFENNKWRYAKILETPGNISIRNIQGNGRIELKRLEAEEARETLGAFIATDGNQKAQTTALWEIANLWADIIRARRYSQAEVWFSLQFCVMESLEYPLMATSLSKTQCDKICNRYEQQYYLHSESINT
jgi:hypothetical protein